jgi:hypothetical protein
MQRFENAGTAPRQTTVIQLLSYSVIGIPQKISANQSNLRHLRSIFTCQKQLKIIIFAALRIVNFAAKFYKKQWNSVKILFLQV